MHICLSHMDNTRPAKSLSMAQRAGGGFYSAHVSELVGVCVGDYPSPSVHRPGDAGADKFFGFGACCSAGFRFEEVPADSSSRSRNSVATVWVLEFYVFPDRIQRPFVLGWSENVGTPTSLAYSRDNDWRRELMESARGS
jgi:hypothetical protein